MKRVGDTAAGQPVFAMGPVQLTLPRGAQRFYPVGACSRCGAMVEFPEPVLSAADLELSRQPHLCQTCARTGIDASGSTRPGGRSSRPSRTPSAKSEPSGEPDERTADAAPATAPDGPDTVWAPKVTDVDPSLRPSSAAMDRQSVPTVRRGGGNDVEQLLQAGVNESWGGAGPPGRAAAGNGPGDAFDRAGEYVALVLRSAIMRAHEIRADAEKDAAQLVESAEQRAAELQAAAALTVEEADRDRDEVMALASQLEETFAGEQQQLTRRLAEAEARAVALREAAEAQARQILQAAEADAARIREAARAVPEPAAGPSVDESRASALLAAAQTDAARILEAAEAERAEASAVLSEARTLVDQQRQAAAAIQGEAERQASAVLAAADAEAYRLRASAAAAERAAQAELDAAIAMGIDAGSSQATGP